MAERMPTTRISLLARLEKPGDNEAWQVFENTYAPAIYRIARKRGLQSADAEDVTQKVLLSAAKKVPEWDQSSNGSLRAWLITITRNLLLNELSRRKPDVGQGGDQTQEDHLCNLKTVGTIDWEYRRVAFRFAAEQLEGQFREVIWQSFWRTAVEQQDPTTVANDLGISVGSVYTNKSRVLKRIRDFVVEMDEA